MILETPRLRMDSPSSQEAYQFALWLNDPEVTKYSEQRHTKHTIGTQVDYWYSPATVEPNLVYVIRLLDADLPIGSLAVRVDTNNNVANVGIMIGDKTQWGKGYGFEAWECLCNFLFIEKKIRKIEAGCMSLNAPMIKICTKYGMRHEAIIQAHFLLDKEPVSMHLYGKLAP